MSTQYANGKIVTDGLVLALNAADRNSYVSGSTVWNDLSGNGNSGSLTNGPTFNSGSGGSIVFNGTSQYTSFSTTNLIVNTVSIWLYLKTTAGGAIIYSGTDIFNSNNWEWSIYIYNNNIYFRGSSGSGGTINYPAANYVNSWKNFTLIRDSNSLSYLYENGIYKNQANETSSINTNQLRLGKSGTNYPSINVGNTQIYNRALSATEILQNYNAQKSRFGL
jgi:hypothetical protein